MPNPDVTFAILARNLTAPGLNAAARGFERLGKRGSAALGVITKATIGAGAVVGGVGVTATQQAAEFSSGIQEVNTLLGLGQEAFAELQRDTLAFSAAVGKSTDEVVPALYQAISAGVPRENVFEFLEVAAKASVASTETLETSVDTLSSAVNTYGAENLSARDASDVLFTAVRRGKTTFGELGGSLARVLPVAAAFGIDFEEVLAAITALTLQGVPTSEAVTAVRAVIESSAAPTAEAAGMLDKLGISYGGARLESDGLLSVITDITAATEGDEAALRKLLGTQEAMTGALILTSNEGASFSDILGDMQNSTGASQEAFDLMNDEASRLFEILKANVEVVLIRLGLKVLPLLVAALVWVNANWAKFGKALSKLWMVWGPRLQATWTNFGKALAKLWMEWGPKLKTVWETVIKPSLEGWADILGKVKPAFQAIYDFIKPHWPLLAGIIAAGVLLIAGVTGIGLIPIAIAAALVGIGLFAKHWATIWDGVKGVTETAVNAVIGGINAVIGGINALIDQANSLDFLGVIPDIKKIPLLGEVRLGEVPAFTLPEDYQTGINDLRGQSRGGGQYLTGGGGLTSTVVNVDLSGNFYGQQDFEEQVTRAINKAIEMGQVRTAAPAPAA